MAAFFSFGFAISGVREICKDYEECEKGLAILQKAAVLFAKPRALSFTRDLNKF
jgi:hypothetical protein